MEAALSLRSSGLVPLLRHAARPNWAARVGPSRVRPFRAEAASPPPEKKTARVVAVGAGVLLTCCLGAAYLHRGARAAQTGGPSEIETMVNVQADVLLNILLKRPWEKSGVYGSKTMLLGLVYQQISRDMLARRLFPDEKLQTKLMDLVYERIKKKGYSSLVGMDSADKIMNLLCEEWHNFDGPQEKHELGCLITQALIYQRNYTEAAKICKELLGGKDHIESDMRPHLLYATRNMMLAVEKKLHWERTEGTPKQGEGETEVILKLLEDAKGYLNTSISLEKDTSPTPPIDDDQEDDRVTIMFCDTKPGTPSK